MEIKKIFLIIIIISSLSNCATGFLTLGINKYEDPIKEFKSTGKYKFYGEYNGIINDLNGKYYEYIFYDVLEREDNGHIKILISIDNPSYITLEETKIKKRENSNCILYYEYESNLYKINDISENEMYINHSNYGGFSIYCKNIDNVRSISQPNVNIKYNKRNIAIGVLFRTGYLVSVPIDVVTFPFQYIYFILNAFKF